jgi:hypothetical protein
VIPKRPLPYRYKQPDEVRTLTFDFSKKLLAGAQITGAATLTAEPGVTVSAGFVSHPTVTCLVSGGTLREKYQIRCRVGATNGEVLSLAMTLGIEIAN